MKMTSIRKHVVVAEWSKARWVCVHLQLATASSQVQDALLTSRGTAATHIAGLGGTSLLTYYWVAGLVDRLKLDVQLTLCISYRLSC